MPINASELTAQQQITAIYVAYYDRAPDPAGLTFWVDQLEGGRSLEQIASDFSSAAETIEKYPFFDAPELASADTFITSIYVNLFGRNPDTAGLDFWSDQLESGSTPVGEIILAILEGAQDEASGGFPDSETITNKIDVGIGWAVAAANAGIGTNSNLIAEDVDGQLVVYDQNAFDSATSILNGVTGDPQSVADAQADTDAFFSGAANEGDTFVLTENIDVTEGTSANDTIIGARDGGASTFTLGDQIDGAGGTDTLRIVSNETDLDLSIADLTSVENLSLRASDDIGDVNLAGNAFEAVSIDGQDKVQTSDVTIGEITNGSDITIKDADFDNQNLEINVAEGTDPVTVTVRLVNIDDADAFDGPNGEATLALDASGDGSSNDDTVNLFLDGVKNTDGDMDFYTTDAETFNVTVVSDSELENIGNYYNEDGSDFGPAVVNLVADADLMVGFWDLSDTADVTTTFNITGAGNVSIADFDDGFSDVTVDGSAATGDLELLQVKDNFLAVTTGSGNDTVEITDAATVVALGEGDDKAIVGTNLTTADSDLDGGAGDADVLSVANSIATSGDDFSDNIAGFERLEIGKVAEGSNDVVDVTNFDDVDYVISNGTEAGTAERELQTFDFAGTGDFGGRVFIEGVQIDLPDNLNAGQVAQFIVDNHAEDIKAAYLANNPGEIMESVQLVNFDQIEFEFAQLSGNVPLVDVTPFTGSLSAGAAFGAGSADTPGTDPVNEVQTIEITTAPAGNGTVRFEVDADTDAPLTSDFLVDVEVFGGETTLEIADRVANAIDAAILDQFGTVTVSGATVTIEYDAAELSSTNSNAFNTTFSDTDGTGLGVTVTEVTPGVTPAVETQTFEITSGTDADGGFVQIALAGSGTIDLKVDPNLTEDELGFAIQAQAADIIAAIPELASVNFDSATNELTFTSTLAAGDIPTLSVGNTSGNFPNVYDFNFVDNGVDGSLSGTLTLDEVASGGTLELTDALEGNATVNVTDAGLTGSTDDRFNIKLNGTQQIANTAMLNIAAVETINIETANSDEDNLPTAASDLNLQAADAETVTVAGNHGVDFTGSDLSSMTLLDASGVQATESSAGADDADDVGRVVIQTGANDSDVTILTGNGGDFINAGFVGTDPDDTGSAATIEAGAGNDLVVGSQGDDSIDMGEGADFVQSSGGADTITLGAGNDTYFLADEGDSVINSRDVITDFSANTVGQGPDGAVDEFGAVGLFDDRDGDVIDLSIAGAASLSVEVFANASDATTFLANNDADGEMNIALDSSTGFLYIDTADDGIANSVIELTGVTTIDEAAFII